MPALGDMKVGEAAGAQVTAPSITGSLNIGDEANMALDKLKGAVKGVDVSAPSSGVKIGGESGLSTGEISLGAGAAALAAGVVGLAGYGAHTGSAKVSVNA